MQTWWVHRHRVIHCVATLTHSKTIDVGPSMQLLSPRPVSWAHVVPNRVPPTFFGILPILKIGNEGQVGTMGGKIPTSGNKGTGVKGVGQLPQTVVVPPRPHENRMWWWLGPSDLSICLRVARKWHGAFRLATWHVLTAFRRTERPHRESP